jgi:hypothetical protein
LNFALYVLELPHLHLAPHSLEPKLERWARFLKARSSEELDMLAQEDPNINIARDTLERLSSEPETRRLAEERERLLLAPAVGASADGRRGGPR